MPAQSTREHLRLFRTPSIRNMRVIEVRDSRNPGVKYPAEPGTPHPNVSLFPAHRLTLQAPIEDKPGWIKEVYATEDVDQDSYNYSIKFSGESNSHPIYVRSYVYLRQGYVPLAKQSRDPLFPGEDETPALLAEEEMRESEDDEIRNLYVVVVRVYETLPGPVLTGLQTDPDSNVQYPVSRQFILADAEIPANAGGIVYEREPLSTVKSILVTRDLTPILGVRYETFPEISYTFPGLLVFRGGVLTETRQPASYRSSFSRIVRARVLCYWTVAPEDHSEEVFEPYTVNVRSDGGNFGSVLHNIRSAVIGGRRQPVEPSYPTSTEYPVGEEVLIRAPSERGENGLYKNTLTYIILL